MVRNVLQSGSVADPQVPQFTLRGVRSPWVPCHLPLGGWFGQTRLSVSNNISDVAREPHSAVARVPFAWSCGRKDDDEVSPIDTAPRRLPSTLLSGQ